MFEFIKNLFTVIDTKESCPRHGICCACVLHHKEHGKKLPACLREIEWQK